MGGGDLNLKKSWHPNTMKNMERVWKAEQKDSEEKKRIAELQREISAERSKEDLQRHGEESGVLKKKDDVKLEWMYKGPSQLVNNEDYLLGKAIDKNFEKRQLEVNTKPSTSIRDSPFGSVEAQVDMARKSVEDPLEAIRRRAFEKAKELYNNPVKMKKLQKMAALQTDNVRKHKKDKKKRKKNKKEKRSKRHTKRDKDSDEDENLDALLTAKLKKVIKDRDILKKLKEETYGSSSDSDSEETSKSPHKSYVVEQPQKSKVSARYDCLDSSPRKSRSRSQEKIKKLDHHSGRRHSPEKSREIRNERNAHSTHDILNKSLHSSAEKEERKRYRSETSSNHNQNHDSDDDNFSRRKKTFGLMMADGSKPAPKPLSHRPEYKPAAEAKKPSWQRKERVSLTEEEKERRRQEMLANANWRDKEREAAVKRYRAEEDKEKNQLESNFDENFAMKQFSKATEQASIEGRIKSKLNNIQRSKVSMDKNFARR